MKFISLSFCSFLFINQAFSMESMQDEEININAQNEDGSTSLMRSAAIAELSVVKLLIRSKADVKIKDNQGNTALHYAFHAPLGKNHFELVKILIQNKVDINAKNKNGETALWKLFDNCLPDGVKKSIHQDYPTFVAKKNSVRNCLNEGLKITQLLLEAKADPNLSNQSPLLRITHYYIYDDTIKSITLFIVDLAETMSFNEIIKKIIELLLIHNADMFACNRNWATTYSMLKHNENWAKIMQKCLIQNSSNLPKELAEIIHGYTGIMPEYGEQAQR